MLPDISALTLPNIVTNLSLHSFPFLITDYDACCSVGDVKERVIKLAGNRAYICRYKKENVAEMARMGMNDTTDPYEVPSLHLSYCAVLSYYALLSCIASRILIYDITQY